jgi:hypothetical protein
MSKSWGRIRIRIWIGIKTESRIRIDIEAMTIHNTDFPFPIQYCTDVLIHYTLKDPYILTGNWFLSTMASRGYIFFIVLTYFFLFSEYYAAFCRKLQMQSRQRLQHRGLCVGGSTYSRTQVRIYYFFPVMRVLR